MFGEDGHLPKDILDASLRRLNLISDLSLRGNGLLTHGTPRHLLAQDLTAVIPVNSESSLFVSEGSSEQKLTSYKAILFNLLHLPLIAYTAGAYTPPKSSSLSTTWSQPTALPSPSSQIPTPTYLMLQSNLAVQASVTMPQPLPHPWPHSSCSQKCPPPASPSVKTPSPHMAHFRPRIP